MGDGVGKHLAAKLKRLLKIFHLYIALTTDISEEMFAESPPQVGFHLIEPQKSNIELTIEITEEQVMDMVASVESGEIFGFSDTVLSFDYDAFNDLWSVVYAPLDNYGFEVVCYDLSEGVEQAIKLIEKEIALLCGDVESYIGDLDKEFQEFLDFDSEGHSEGQEDG